MAEINVKLDRILISLEKLTTRIDVLENSVTATHNYVSKLDQKLSQRCDELECAIKQKTDSTMFVDLKNKVEILEAKLEFFSEKEKNTLDYTKRVEQKFESYFMEADRDKLSNEAYSKRLNILIHGIEEHSTNPWETREETRTKLNNFLMDGLRMDNYESLLLVDFHRLPQRPVYKDGIKINRPIIYKLSNIQDKQSVLRATKHLKVYNERRSKNLKNAPSVYITDHLPKPFYLQKKSLLPLFKEAKNLGKKTNWRIMNGEYCLFIDGVKALH